MLIRMILVFLWMGGKDSVAKNKAEVLKNTNGAIATLTNTKSRFYFFIKKLIQIPHVVIMLIRMPYLLKLLLIMGIFIQLIFTLDFYFILY